MATQWYIQANSTQLQVENCCFSMTRPLAGKGNEQIRISNCPVSFTCPISRKLMGPTSLTFPLGSVFPQKLSYKKYNILHKTLQLIKVPYLIKLLYNTLTNSFIKWADTGKYIPLPLTSFSNFSKLEIIFPHQVLNNWTEPIRSIWRGPSCSFYPPNPQLKPFRLPLSQKTW